MTEDLNSEAVYCYSERLYLLYLALSVLPKDLLAHFLCMSFSIMIQDPALSWQLETLWVLLDLVPAGLVPSLPRSLAGFLHFTDTVIPITISFEAVLCIHIQGKPTVSSQTPSTHQEFSPYPPTSSKSQS